MVRLRWGTGASFLNISSILRKFIETYFIVFFVPFLIVFVVLYNIGANGIRAKISQLEEAKLTQIKYYLDGELDKVSIISNSINNITEIRSLMGLNENEFGPSDILSLYTISVKISNMHNKVTSSNNTFIYFAESNYFVTSYNALSGERMFSNQYGSYMDDHMLEELYEMLGGRHDRELVSLRFTDKRSSKPGELMFYLQSVPILPVNSAKACVVTQFGQEIFDIFTRDDNSALADSICILNENGSKLLETGSNFNYDFLIFDMLEGTHGSFTHKKATIYYLKSDIIPAYIVAAVPHSDMMPEINSLKYVSVLIFTACMIIGCFLALHFSKRSYEPIRSLLGLSSRLSRQLPEKNTNEYSLISTALNSAIREKAFHEELAKTELLVKLEKKMIDTLWHSGKYEFLQDFLNIARQRGIIINDCYFCVVLIRLEESVSDISETIIVCKKAFGNTLEKHGSVFILNYEMSLFVVLSMENESAGCAGDLIDDISKSQDYLCNEYHFKSQVAISAFHYGLDSLLSAFKEADDAMQHILLIGKETITFFNNAPDHNSSILSRFSIKEKQALSGRIKSGDFIGAIQLFKAILEKYFYGSDIIKSGQITRYRLYLLINSIAETIISVDTPEIRTIAAASLNTILSCKSTTELEHHVIMLLNDLNTYKIMAEDTAKQLLLDKITSLVKENYSNDSFNVGFIADKTGRDIDSISKFFKKNTNCNLLDYIHQTRINAAKELLTKKSYLSIEHISVMVGYKNNSSFIRVFKKALGMTPGKFRELYIEDNKSNEGRGSHVL